MTNFLKNNSALIAPVIVAVLVGGCAYFFQPKGDLDVGGQIKRVNRAQLANEIQRFEASAREAMTQIEQGEEMLFGLGSLLTTALAGTPYGGLASTGFAALAGLAGGWYARKRGVQSVLTDVAIDFNKPGTQDELIALAQRHGAEVPRTAADAPVP